MSSLQQENHRRLIIENLNLQRPGSRLRIHLEDLVVAVPENHIELRRSLGQQGTQLIDISTMNNWLNDSGYSLKTIKVEHDENGAWAIVEKTI